MTKTSVIGWADPTLARAYRMLEQLVSDFPIYPSEDEEAALDAIRVAMSDLEAADEAMRGVEL